MILIIIADSSNSNTTQVLLVTTSTIIASLHVIIRPYSRKILNIFEGIILHQMILASKVPLVENFRHYLMMSVTLALVVFLL